MSNKERLLIVDDEPDLREIIAVHAEHIGFSTEQAVDGKQALQKAKEQQFDVVISDLMMPNMTGLELLKAMRRQNINIPFIFLSAYSSNDLTLDALKNGAFDYIRKPFGEEELKRLLKEAMRISKESQATEELNQRLNQVSHKHSVEPSEQLQKLEKTFRKMRTLSHPEESQEQNLLDFDIDVDLDLPEDEQLIQLFISEVTSQLIEIEKSLTSLEENDSKEWKIGFLFRTMQSVHGAAESLDNKQLSRVTERFKDLYAQLRIVPQYANKERLQILLKTHAKLRSSLNFLKANKNNNQQFNQMTEEIISNLESFLIPKAG